MDKIESEQLNRLLLCTLPQFFVADLVGSADLQDLPQAGVDEDLDVLHGGDGGSPGLGSVE
jgi:hypothetical protein